jgi:excisionase family DNA binding protein
VDTQARDYQEVIDQALGLVYSHHNRLITRLAPSSFVPLDIEDLRDGPLGRDLQRLANLARGQTREEKELVLRAIEDVLQLLFWPAAADEYTVPRSFWDTDLGRMMALAKFRAYEPHELVSIGVAAETLQVTRPTIYRWMDDRRLNYVKDEISGRTFIVRRDLENLTTVGSDLDLEPSQGGVY